MAMNGSRLGVAMYNALQAYDKGATAGDARQRMIVMATEIVNEISNYATIATQSTTSTPSGTGPHIHSPIVTATTGKIS